MRCGTVPLDGSWPGQYERTWSVSIRTTLIRVNTKDFDPYQYERTLIRVNPNERDPCQSERTRSVSIRRNATRVNPKELDPCQSVFRFNPNETDVDPLQSEQPK